MRISDWSSDVCSSDLEAARPGVTGKLIVDAVLDAHPHAAVAWMPSLADAADYLAARLRTGDLCLTLGAGDLTSLPEIGSASCRERVCAEVQDWVVAGTLKKRSKGSRTHVNKKY